MKFLTFSTFLLLMLSIYPVYAEKLLIYDAWMRATATYNPTVAVYATIHNVNQDRPLILKAVEGNVAQRIEIHESSLVDGVMKMRRLEKIEIASGEKVQLKPMGLHIMLIKPHQQFLVGQVYPLTFLFEGGQKETVNVHVKPLLFKP